MMSTDAPQMLDVLADNIPGELIERDQWIVWEPEVNPRGKLDKIPYDPRTDRHASTTDPKTWATFDEAWAAYQMNVRWGGIGYVFSDDDPYAGVDLDDCRDPDTGKATTDSAREIVKSLNSYAEASPSGTGVKIIVRANLDRARVDHEQGIEIYGRARFFTVTGHVLPKMTRIRDAQEPFDTLLKRFPEKTKRDPDDRSGYIATRVPTEQLIDKATAAKNGETFWNLWRGRWEGIKESQSEADAALCRYLAFWTGPDRGWIDDLFRDSGLYREEKWERASYRERTIDLALDGLTDWYQWHPPQLNSNGVHKQPSGSVTIDDFRAYMPDHKYIFIPSRELWPATSVNARLKPIIVGEDEDGKPIKVPANKWLDEHQPVEQMTWAPGEPELIEGRLMSQGGWVDRPGCTVFNLYRPPTIRPGNPGKAQPWLDHIEFTYGELAEHLIQWFAHRVQRPAEKINHAIVLGGSPGIGKDTMLEPVKQAIGPWNFYEVTPTQMLGRFNGFVQSIILRVSEARDLGDVDRYTFYDHLKGYAAAPPDVIRVDEKYLREYQVMNVCGVVITTNHLNGGLYLPPDDRRHFVAWSERTMHDFTPDYWTNLYQWYEQGGYADVAAYLAELDLSGFNPKEPPPKTTAFWDMVSSNLAPEDAELSDILDQLYWPEALTLSEIIGKADTDLAEWLRDRKNSRQIPHRMEEAGYVRVRNENSKDGLWKIANKRQTIYAKKTLNPRQRITAARELLGSYA